MNLSLGNDSDRTTREWKVPSRFWEHKPLPNTVAPSFDTCNLSRTYELEIRVGLTHTANASVQPELAILPLRLPVRVYSGVAPPPDLLQAMASHAAQNPFHPANIVNATTGSPQSYHPPTPVTPTHEQSPYPAQDGVSGPQPHPEEFGDAPPSYEDAMAEDIAPVDGPRRDYTVPVDPAQRDNAFNDSKSSGLRRQVSERLFSSNGSSSPRRSTFGSSSSAYHENVAIQEEDAVADGFRHTAQSPARSQTKS